MTFVFDNLPPLTAVTAPSNTSILKALAQIKGTLVDQPVTNPPDRGDDRSIQRLDTGNIERHGRHLGVGGFFTNGSVQGVEIWTSTWDSTVNMPTVGNGGLVPAPPTNHGGQHRQRDPDQHRAWNNTSPRPSPSTTRATSFIGAPCRTPSTTLGAISGGAFDNVQARPSP